LHRERQSERIPGSMLWKQGRGRSSIGPK
jgi:hypothetical protein